MIDAAVQTHSSPRRNRHLSIIEPILAREWPEEYRYADEPYLQAVDPIERTRHVGAERHGVHPGRYAQLLARLGISRNVHFCFCTLYNLSRKIRPRAFASTPAGRPVARKRACAKGHYPAYCRGVRRPHRSAPARLSLWLVARTVVRFGHWRCVRRAILLFFLSRVEGQYLCGRQRARRERPTCR